MRAACAGGDPDRLELEGLVLLPPDARGPLPMVVDIHGGPSWAAKYAFNPGYAVPLAAAGYAVFLPNYRGNAGWGQAFAKLNIGDPAGAEFDRHSPRHRSLRGRWDSPIPTGSA